MFEVDLPVLLALAVISLVGGIGITALGPGGVSVTIGLFALTDLSPASVAGTSMVANVGAGLFGTAVFRHSGQFQEPLTRRMSITLAATAIVGTPIGVLVNADVSTETFGMLLGVFVAIVAALILYRERRVRGQTGPAVQHPLPLLVLLGLTIAVISGVFGVGGPLLAVPALIAIGMPLLPALAAAQAQSVVISTVGSIGYAAQYAVDWPLALVVGVPVVIGVVIGWKIAGAIPTRRLTRALVFVLFAVAAYLIMR